MPWARRRAIVAGIVVACVLGSLAAMLMLAPRVYFAMARDGLFRRGSRRSPRFGTPARAIGAQALLASVLVLFGTFDSIVAYFIFVTVAFIGLTVAAVFVLLCDARPGVSPGTRGRRSSSCVWLADCSCCSRSTTRCRLRSALPSWRSAIYRARSGSPHLPVTDGDSLMTWIGQFV